MNGARKVALPVSVTHPLGFRGAGVTAGFESSVLADLMRITGEYTT